MQLADKSKDFCLQCCCAYCVGAQVVGVAVDMIGLVSYCSLQLQT